MAPQVLSEDAKKMDPVEHHLNYKCMRDGHPDQAPTEGKDTVGPVNFYSPHHDDEDQGDGADHAR